MQQEHKALQQYISQIPNESELVKSDEERMVILQLKQEIDDLKNKNQSLLQEAGEKQQLENQISQLMAEKRSFEEKQSEATQDQIVTLSTEL